MKGSITLLGQGKGRCRRPVLSFDCTHTQVVDAAIESFGGFRPQAQSHRWRMNGSAAVDHLELIRPYLRLQRRRRLADALIEDSMVRRTAVPYSKVAHMEDLHAHLQYLNSIHLRRLPSIPVQDPSPADIQYFAGMFDVQGTLRERTQQAEIVSVDPELPAWLKSRFGGNTYLLRRQRGRQLAKFRWVSSMRDQRWHQAVDHMLTSKVVLSPQQTKEDQ